MTTPKISPKAVVSTQVRIPATLHAQLRKEAYRRDMSLNKLIVTMLVAGEAGSVSVPNRA